MNHKQFQEWLSGIEQLSAAQRQEAEAVFAGVRKRQLHWRLLKRVWVRHTRSDIAWQGAGPAAISVQGVQEDI